MWVYALQFPVAAGLIGDRLRRKDLYPGGFRLAVELRHDAHQQVRQSLAVLVAVRAPSEGFGEAFSISPGRCFCWSATTTAPQPAPKPCPFTNPASTSAPSAGVGSRRCWQSDGDGDRGFIFSALPESFWRLFYMALTRRTCAAGLLSRRFAAGAASSPRSAAPGFGEPNRKPADARVCRGQFRRDHLHDLDNAIPQREVWLSTGGGGVLWNVLHPGGQCNRRAARRNSRRLACPAVRRWTHAGAGLGTPDRCDVCLLRGNDQSRRDAIHHDVVVRLLQRPLRLQ